MTEAWEQLISGSTIQNGDAWEHLLAQGKSFIIHKHSKPSLLSVQPKIVEVVVAVKEVNIKASNG